MNRFGRTGLSSPSPCRSQFSDIPQHKYDNLKDFHNTVAKIEEDKVIGGFINGRRKQIIRTYLLLETGSDYFSLPCLDKKDAINGSGIRQVVFTPKN